MDWGIPMHRRLAAAAAMLGAGFALMAAGPADALAGTLSRSGSVVTYSAGGENNNVTVSQSVNGALQSITVSDTTGVQPGAGCTEVNANTGRCDLSTLTEVKVYTGGGNDIVHADTVSVPVYIEGAAGADDLFGGSAADTLEGGGDFDELDGNGGSDDLFGRGGPDNLTGDGGDDLLDGGIDNDVLSGGLGNDDMIGYLADDDLSGGGGFDDLDGGAGRDELNGGAQEDTYQGGTEADTINSVDATNEDVDCGGGIFSGADTATLNTGDFILFNSCENHTFVPPTS
jgi:Ca2+-binding RTX toxin-like protein